MGQRVVVGVADHHGWAVLMSLAAPRHRVRVLDRRRIALIEPGLPTAPIHHEGQSLPLDEARKLVDAVRASVEQCAEVALDALTADLGAKPAAIALRECPALPAPLEEKISSYPAQNVADSVMYREILASSAEARGCAIHWFVAKRAEEDAADATEAGSDAIQSFLF
jgi:hypothetical protein